MKKSWTAHYAGGMVEKNLKNCSDRTMRVNIVRNLLKTKNLPAKTGAELLDVNCTSIYYQKPSESDEDLECKEVIDRIHIDNPSWGARQISPQFKQHAITLAEKRRVTIWLKWVFMPFIRR